MLRFDRVEIGTGGLPMCARSDEPRQPVMRSFEEIESAIHRAVATHKRGPGPNITFTGTEAFLHPDLPRMITQAAAAGVERIGITTGGAALAQGENAAGCLHAGVRHVDIVLLAGEETHDALSGMPGSYSAARRGVVALQDAATVAGVRIALMGHVPVCRHNVHELPQAVATFVGMGAIAVHLAPHSDLDVQRHIEWFGAAFQTGIMHGVWVCAEPADVTLFDRWALHVGDPCHVGGGAR